MSETIERARVVEALEIAVQGVEKAAGLPRLTVAQHAELIGLRTVAFLLDLDEVADRITVLIDADANHDRRDS
jgi:hypothetical protein